MTENEAIKKLEPYLDGIDSDLTFMELFYKDVDRSEYLADRDAFTTAITALKEIQQYREVDAQIKKIFDDQLGLVDIVKEYIEDIRRTHNGKTPRKVIALSEEDAQNWEDYKKIGTVEVCREAVEKQKAKKPLLVSKKKKKIMEGDYVDVICPSCQGRIFGCFLFYPWNDSQREHEFCKSCGQAIRWDENLGGNVDEKN